MYIRGPDGLRISAGLDATDVQALAKEAGRKGEEALKGRRAPGRPGPEDGRPLAGGGPGDGLGALRAIALELGEE